MDICNSTAYISQSRNQQRFLAERYYVTFGTSHLSVCSVLPVTLLHPIFRQCLYRLIA